MANVVEIVIMGKNLASPAIKGAEAEAKGLGSTWNKVGMVAGAALLAIGVESTKMAVDFEAHMQRLTTQAGVATSEMGTLKAGVLSLAGKVGADPDSLAESLFHVESNFESVGITSEEALRLVEISAKGAKVGNADLVEVTNALTAAVAAQIPGVENLDGAMGALNATVGVGDMTMGDLAKAFGTGMVAVVKGYGLSITDVGAALAVFGDNNVRGAQAGTQLRMAVQSLAVPAKTGKAALEALGLTSHTLAEDMQKGGLKLAVADLHDRLVAMNPDMKTWGDMITQMFGKKAGTGLSMLVTQYDRFGSKFDALADASGTFGESWAGTQDTLKQKLDQMKGAFDALAITIGTKLIPIVTAIFNYFSDHTEVLKILAIVVGVFLVGAFVAWGVSVIMATWPIILVIAAVAALVVIAYELWKHWDAVWGGIKSVTETVTNFIYNTLIMGAWHAIYWFFVTTLFGWFKDNWPLLLAIITGPFGLAIYFIHEKWDTIAGFFSSVVTAIKNAFVGAYHAVADPIISAVDAVIRKVGEIAGAVKGAVDKATSMIKNIPGVSTVAGWFGHATGGFVSQAATGGGRGNLTQINEHGPELIDLPSGTKVWSASDSARMAGQGGGRGGGQPVVLVLQSDGTRLGKLLIEVLRESIRDKGGNVQIVLGGS